MLERRFLSNIALRATESTKGQTITGLAARFGILSENLGGFRETLQAGCFSIALRNPKTDVLCVLNHDDSKILGRQSNGSLALVENDQGLRFTCKLPATTEGRDTYTKVKDGLLTECSFAFNTDDDGQSWGDGTDPETNEPIAIRTIRSVKALYDIALVARPAYSNTSVSANSAVPVGYTPRDLWPTEIPLEIRSHVPSLASVYERRRRLTANVLSL